MTSELGRRIGSAKTIFETLQRVWRHSSITLSRKLLIFDACVVSKLTYGLAAAHLNAAGLRRLDGFQARCLCKILGIAHSFWSRISNAEVLRRANSSRVSLAIQRQQMVLMGRIARGELGEQVRECFFMAGTCQLPPLPGRRRVGRPRHTWRQSVHELCLRAAGSMQQLESFLSPSEGATLRWRRVVDRFIHTL